MTAQKGQTWVTNLEKYGQFTVPLTSTSPKGHLTRAARSPQGKAWTGTLFHREADNVMIYDMSDGQVFITGRFDQKGVKGRSMQSAAFDQKGEKAESEDAGACAATL